MLKYAVIYFQLSLIITGEDLPKNSDNQKTTLRSTSDSEWHITNLKEPDFVTKGDCPPESLQETALKYKNILRQDPGFIQYVGADTLPQNESDLEAAKHQVGKKCRPYRRSEDYMFSSSEYSEGDPDEECADQVTVLELNVDQIRKYDIECERITEWTSLE